MSKVTLDELRKKYSDRPDFHESKTLPPLPANVELGVNDSVTSKEVLGNKKQSNFKAMSLMILSGVFVFSGFVILANMELNRTTRNESVLGVNTPQNNVEEESEDLDQYIAQEQEFVNEEADVEEAEAYEPEVQVFPKVRVIETESGFIDLRRSPLVVPFTTAKAGTEFEMFSQVIVGSDVWYEVRYDETSTCWIRSDLVEKL